MRPKYSAADRKITVCYQLAKNLSFDFTGYAKPRCSVLPQTTVNRVKVTNMSPGVDSSSPRKRLFSAKRVPEKVNKSLNSSKQINSKRQSQHRNNLTIKTGSSIEALKDMLGKQSLTTTNKAANLKYLLQLNSEKNRVIEKDRSQHLEIRTSDSTERVLEKRAPVKKLSATRTKTTSKEKTELKKANSLIMDKQKDLWAKVKIPISPEECLAQFSTSLSDFEKIEILEYKKIYCIGVNAKKSMIITEFNDGYDDSKGEYIYQQNDHIGYRYELLEPVGKGSFGQAFKVFDHKKHQTCCLKIIRNKKKFQNQALVELNILSYIKDKDEENITNIIKIKDYVIFRNHVCIVSELLSMNLYELIKSNNYQGLNLELIRRFAIQILNSLNFLYKHRIVHCDLKPENILLKQPNKSGIKIIDFGSSCFEHERIYSYIQSRYYRAPEVMLGLPYEMAIDMWSFGCIMAELFIGYPIFPGENEQEQIAYILEMIGMPDQDLVERSSRRKHFFTNIAPYQALQYTNKRGKIRLPGTKDIRMVIRSQDDNFPDFLLKCLTWDPEKRMKPLEALMHPWILEGLPSEIRNQHVKYLESEQITQKVFFKPRYDSSEAEVNEYKKRPPQIRTMSKDKEISLNLQQTLVPDLTPQHKKLISSSFHTSKNATIQKQQFHQYFPGTQKSEGNKKQQYFH